LLLFPRRGGHAPELDNFDHLLGLGRTLGRMHGVGGAADFNERIDYTLERWLIEPLNYLSTEWVPNELLPAWDSLGKDLVDRAARLMKTTRRERAYGYMETAMWAIFSGATIRRTLSISMTASPGPRFKIYGCFYRAIARKENCSSRSSLRATRNLMTLIHER
jgi:hypothetical protein